MLPGLDGMKSPGVYAEGTYTPVLCSRRGTRNQTSSVVSTWGDDTSLSRSRELLAASGLLPAAHSASAKCRWQTFGSIRKHRFPGERTIHLTVTEFRLLESNAPADAGKPTRTCRSCIGGFEDVGTTLSTHLSRCFAIKVDKGHRRKLIHTVRGIGYSLREES